MNLIILELSISKNDLIVES